MGDVYKYSHAASDFCRLLKSRILGTAADDGNRVFAIPIARRTFVTGVFCLVTGAGTTASSAAVTVGLHTIDDSGNAIDTTDYFMLNTDTLPLVLGMKSGQSIAKQAYYFKNGGSITVSFAKGTSVADVLVQIFADTYVIS